MASSELDSRNKVPPDQVRPLPPAERNAIVASAIA